MSSTLNGMYKRKGAFPLNPVNKKRRNQNLDNLYNQRDSNYTYYDLDGTPLPKPQRVAKNVISKYVYENKTGMDTMYGPAGIIASYL